MPPSSPLQASAEIRQILADACEARELLFLVTPYIRFESNFLHLEPEALHARITMGVEEATYALRSTDLHLRFPSLGRFLDGSTKLLGFGMLEGRRTLRLTIPKSLKDDEQRGAYRVERVGRVAVTYSTERYDLDTGNLANLSTTGARITAGADPASLGLEAGARLSLSIPLTDDIKINHSAVVQWIQGRAFGVAFKPPLPESVMVPLGRWIFQRREEELERASRAPVSHPTQAQQPGQLGGVVLLSTSEELEAWLRAGWVDLPPLVRAAPVLQSLKDALAASPLLVMVHVPDAGLDFRRRIKSLAEAAGNRVPLFLLGTGIPQATLFELGQEVHAVSVFGLPPGPPPPFLFRLLQGILRRHSGGEGAS